MRNAQGFIKKKNYHQATPVTRVIDGGEPMEFKSLFRFWRDQNQISGVGKSYSVGRGVAKVVSETFDPSSLHDNHALAAEMQMADDGSGTKEVFRVKEFDLIKVDGEDVGRFYSGGKLKTNFIFCCIVKLSQLQIVTWLFINTVRAKSSFIIGLGMSPVLTNKAPPQ